MLAAVAERIRRHVVALSVKVTTLYGPTVVTGLSVSIGGARYPDHGPDLDTLLLVADASATTPSPPGGTPSAASRPRHRCWSAPAPDLRTPVQASAAAYLSAAAHTRRA